MGRYIATITLHIDTQQDGRRAAEHICEDVRDWALSWLGVTEATYTLEEDQHGTA